MCRHTRSYHGDSTQLGCQRGRGVSLLLSRITDSQIFQHPVFFFFHADVKFPQLSATISQTPTLTFWIDLLKDPQRHVILPFLSYFSM